MSHLPLRTNKTCLNCGFQVEERYCSRCGQENLEPRESLGHLVSHFLSDFTHYDSKFLTSLRDLVIKPGFLTREYNAGRRAAYLNPIRMYIFISAVFFLVLFGGNESGPSSSKPLPADTLSHPVGELSLNAAFHNTDAVITVVENKYTRVGQYDSAQAALALSDTARDDSRSRWFMHRMIHLRERHPGRQAIVITQNVGGFIPKAMFVLLPLFALYMRLLYSRRKFVYTQHVIFSLHFHSFIFLVFLLGQVAFLFNPGFVGVFTIAGVSILWIFAYLAIALHRTYAQALWISLLKAIALWLMYVITIQIVAAILWYWEFSTA
jgi:hypothetical protein